MIEECYAKGFGNIKCDPYNIGTFSIMKHVGRRLVTVKDAAGYICKTHYNILAEIQDKPNMEERQKMRVAKTYRIKHSPQIPDADWWKENSELVDKYVGPWIFMK